MEFAWFAPSCVGDSARLGVDDPKRRATYEYNRQVVLDAETAGFDSILIPSSYVPGMDPWTLACALAPGLTTIGLLPAVRVGEFDPPMFARAAKNLQLMLGGRLAVNIISSERAGERMGTLERYRRTAEAMALLRSFWTDEQVVHDGEYWSYDLGTGPTRTRTPPAFYFGGTSEPAREAAAEHADCYLMWIEGTAAIGALVQEMRERAADHGRSLRFGLRTHVIVRDTEDEARAAAADIVSNVDPGIGQRLRQVSHDHRSEGVRRQDALRDAAGDDGFVEAALWTGIGVARSGVGAAITGSTDQVVAKLREYAALGIDTFILSGYPLDDEAVRVGRTILPHF